VAGAVFDVFDEGVVAAGQREKFAGEGEVVDFDFAVEIVDLAIAAFQEGGQDAGGVVFDVDPVAALHAVAVDGDFLAGQEAHDEQRDHFFGPMPGAVVVGAAGHDGGEVEGADKGLHEQFAAGFARGVGAAGVDGVGLDAAVREGHIAVDFIGGDLKERFMVPFCTRGREASRRTCTPTVLAMTKGCR